MFQDQKQMTLLTYRQKGKYHYITMPMSFTSLHLITEALYLLHFVVVVVVVVVIIIIIMKRTVQ
jgi:hypothetical protein